MNKPVSSNPDGMYTLSAGIINMPYFCRHIECMPKLCQLKTRLVSEASDGQA